MTPEEKARLQIDAMLVASGWLIQDYKALNLGTSRGIALREVPLVSARCDYLLIVDRVPVGVVEAKKEGTTLSTVADLDAYQISQSAAAKKNPLACFTDLISLVRFALEQKPVLEPFEEHVRRRFAVWLKEKRATGIAFTADQLLWLEKMRDYISTSGSGDREHLVADNVLDPIYKEFGERLWPLMEELNLTLAA